MSHQGLLFNWFCSGGEEHFGQEPTAQNHGEIIAWPAGSSEGLQPGSPALCSTGTGHCTSRPRWGGGQNKAAPSCVPRAWGWQRHLQAKRSCSKNFKLVTRRGPALPQGQGGSIQG